MKNPWQLLRLSMVVALGSSVLSALAYALDHRWGFAGMWAFTSVMWGCAFVISRGAPRAYEQIRNLYQGRNN